MVNDNVWYNSVTATEKENSATEAVVAGPATTAIVLVVVHSQHCYLPVV